MQRSDKLEKSAGGIREKIKQDYFQPFIGSLKKSNLDASLIIREIFWYLQHNYAGLYFSLFNQTGKIPEFPHNFDKPMLKKIIVHPQLTESITRLCKLYLDMDKQEYEFPGTDPVEIQTCIRELFHDYLNPLPKMQIQNLNTSSLRQNGSQIKNNGSLFDIPVEIQHIIHSYLNYESAFSFKRTCKSAYFLHKSIQDKQASIFYLIAGDVKISSPRKFYEIDLDIPLRFSVSKEEIIKSLQKTSNHTSTEEVKIFHSLYHALEYSHSLQHGGHIDDDEEEGFIPSIWVVAYIGNPAHLRFNQEKIVLNEGSMSSVYDGNRRDALISYAMTPTNSIQPLLGAVIFSCADFGNYKTFNIVDFMKYQRENRKVCSIM